MPSAVDLVCVCVFDAVQRLFFCPFGARLCIEYYALSSHCDPFTCTKATYSSSTSYNNVYDEHWTLNIEDQHPATCKRKSSCSILLTGKLNVGWVHYNTTKLNRLQISCIFRMSLDCSLRSPCKYWLVFLFLFCSVPRHPLHVCALCSCSWRVYAPLRCVYTMEMPLIQAFKAAATGITAIQVFLCGMFAFLLLNSFLPIHTRRRHTLVVPRFTLEFSIKLEFRYEKS